MNDMTYSLGGISGALTLQEHYALLMAPLDRRVRAIVEERILPDRSERATLDALGRRFGITRERVRQLEAKGRDLIADLPPLHAAALVDRADALAADLGPLAPLESDRTRLALVDAVEDVWPSDRVAVRRLLLRIAGYSTQRGWLVRDEVRLPTADAALDLAGGEGSTLRRLRESLVTLGVDTADHDAWLATHADLMLIGDHVVRRGRNVIDDCASVLRVVGATMTVEEMLAELGSRHSPRGVRNRLLEDERFVRTSKSRFGLREWQSEEYAGLAPTMARIVRDHGGEMDLDELVAAMGERFGANPASVRAYADALTFVRHGNRVRLRGKREAIAVDTDSAAVETFRTGPAAYSWTVPVDRGVLRGSGRLIPAPLAIALGLRPGSRRIFRHVAGSVSLTWPMTAFVGPSVGSLRTLAEAAGAAEGDRIELRFDVAAGTLAAITTVARAG